jgi:hypothetical protein
MLKIKYELNGEKKQFEAALPYTMIGVKQNQVCYLFQNYDEVEKQGKKICESFDIIPCVAEGVCAYDTKFILEKFNPERDNYIWVEPVRKEPETIPVETTNKKVRKGRKKR